MFPYLLIIFSKSFFDILLPVCDFGLLGELGMVSQREDGWTCRWLLSQRAITGDTGREGEIQRR